MLTLKIGGYGMKITIDPETLEARENELKHLNDDLKSIMNRMHLIGAALQLETGAIDKGIELYNHKLSEKENCIRELVEMNYEMAAHLYELRKILTPMPPLPPKTLYIK